MATKSKKRGLSCSAVGCPNYQNNPNSIGVKFFIFPSDPERCERWVNALKRQDKAGNPWRPTITSRLCSAHFVGGKKSNDINSPCYLPTIFPTGHRKPATVNDVARFERAKRRLDGFPMAEKPQEKEKSETTDSSNRYEFFERIFLDTAIQTKRSTEKSLGFTWTCDAPSSTEKATMVSVPGEITCHRQRVSTKSYTAMTTKAKARCRPIFPCMRGSYCSNSTRTSVLSCCSKLVKRL